MPESAASILTPWLTFFTMVGAAAATLTGLMFVVITLVTGANRQPSSSDGFGTFSTPTVLHFGAALLISAILCAPWPTFIGPFALIGIGAVYCLVHMVRVIQRIRRLSIYTPDAEDWIFYTILPFVGYFAVFAGDIALLFAPRGALYVLAGGTLLLIFIGIRNAWDVVTYLTIYTSGQPPGSS